jgi:hypothetical protein
MKSIGESVENEDPTNKLLDVQTQVEWLRAIGFEDVDCYWKWLELALLIGYRPVEPKTSRGPLAAQTRKLTPDFERTIANLLELSSLCR